MNSIRKILEAVAKEHPYKIPSRRETYDKYNEGWTDAVDRIESMLPEQTETQCYLGSPCEYQNPDVEIAQLSQEDATKGATFSCGHENDTISRHAAVEFAMKYCPDDDGAVQCDGDIRGLLDELENLPSAQPEIILCKDCIFYDPPHVENKGCRIEYKDLPKEAFDELGTGLVSAEYGINIGGRCCVDYYCKNYSDDKRVYVPKDNYCGRAVRRTDG